MIIKNKQTKELLLEIKDEYIISTQIEQQLLLIEVKNEYNYIQYIDSNFRPLVYFMQDNDVDFINISLSDDMEVLC